jgi:hypothetical protein
MKETCFILMPFREPLNDYYKEIICPAVTNTGLTPLRADEIYGTQSIILDIVQQISNAKILIADLTFRNPNVTYELGVAHSLKKPVIMLVQDINDVPFDLNHHRIIHYDTTKVKWDLKLSQNIEETIKAVLLNPENSKPFDIDFFENKISPSLKKLLASTTQKFKIKLSISEDIYVDENGNCELIKKRNVTALSDITHELFETYVDKPGKVTVKKVFDEQLKKDLDFFTYEETDLSHSFFVIFDETKVKGTVFNHLITISAENYLSDIIDKGVGYRRTFIYFNTKLDNLRENYYFPNIPIFKKLKAYIHKHPKTSLIGKEIVPEETEKYLIFRVYHDNLLRYTPEFEIKFEITSHNNV